jgi:hypothetical protein
MLIGSKPGRILAQSGFQLEGRSLSQYGAILRLINDQFRADWGLIGVDLDDQKLIGGGRREGGRRRKGRGNWVLIWEPIKVDCSQS